MDQASQLRNMVKTHHLQERSARVITVTSGKGGVGKTNTSVNLAIQFRKMGKKVIIIDADFGLANIEILFGILPRMNLADLIFKGKDIEEIITVGPMGVEFISGGSGIQELTHLSREQLYYIIEKLNLLDKLADIIIIDTGAGISTNVIEFIMASKEILVVTTPEPTSITDSYALLKALRKIEDYPMEEATIHIVTNRISNKKEGEDIFTKLDLVVKKFLNIELHYLGLIPQDNHLQKAVIEQNPLSISYPNAPATRAYEEIANKILSGSDAPVTSHKYGMAQFLSNFLKLKSKK